MAVRLPGTHAAGGLPALLHVRRGKNIPKWQPIVYSIIVTGALYVAFVYMLKLRLPVGTLLDISL